MATVETTRFGHGNGQPSGEASSRSFPPALARHSSPAADRVLAAVTELNAPYLHERSFKLVDGAVLDSRFLLSFSPRSLGKHAVASFSFICTRLAMPGVYLPAIEANLPDASFIHLGFEQGVDDCTYKAYLEFPRPSGGEPAAVEEPRTPALVYLAFKWRPGQSGGHTVARYVFDPSLDLDGIAGSLKRIYGGRTSVTCELAERVARLSAGRMPFEDMVFVEVHEENNPRRSYDICVYDAGLKVKDIEPQLERLWRHFRVPRGSFRQIVRPLREEPLGHVSGGTGRDGKEFFSVYYGVREN